MAPWPTVTLSPMVSEWPDAMYVCLNYGEASAPEEITKKSICINGDIGEILSNL